MIDKEYNVLFLNEETYNNYEKLHFQIKSSLEKQKIKESDINVKFSQIINNCINIENNIINWIKEKTKKNTIEFELIFKMSENGTNSEDFHKYCDNKGPTLTIIQTTKNKKFGGFTPLNWGKEGESIVDKSEQTFIFSLNQRKEYDIKDKKKQLLSAEKITAQILETVILG